MSYDLLLVLRAALPGFDVHRPRPGDFAVVSPRHDLRGVTFATQDGRLDLRDAVRALATNLKVNEREVFDRACSSLFRWLETEDVDAPRDSAAWRLGPFVAIGIALQFRGVKHLAYGSELGRLIEHFETIGADVERATEVHRDLSRRQIEFGHVAAPEWADYEIARAIAVVCVGLDHHQLVTLVHRRAVGDARRRAESA